jgi:hypothetical protein
MGNEGRQKNSVKTKVVCFGEEITGTKATKLRTALGLSLGEGVSFMGNFFSDIQPYVSNEKVHDNLLGAKDR